MGQADLIGDHRAVGDPPPSALDRIFARFLAIDLAETLFVRRGFPDTPARPRLERAAATFITGYNAALGAPGPGVIAAKLGEWPAADRGFLAEGAAMGAAVRTACLPWHDSLSPLLAALHRHYAHLAHVGVGWALARLPFARRRLMHRLDPMFAPLAFDGWGFHDGYFRPVAIATSPGPAIAGASGRVYDQGLGRSLWFSCGADPARIVKRVTSFEEERHSDLWAGVGLACVYAGGSNAEDVRRLVLASGTEVRWLRQGAAFAIGAHARAGAVPAEIEARAKQICGLDAITLTAISAEGLATARRNPASQPRPYQDWRHRVADAVEARAA